MNSTLPSTLPHSPPSSSIHQNRQENTHNRRVSSLRASPTPSNLWDPSSVRSPHNISQWKAIRRSWIAERAAFASAEHFWAFHCDGENTFCRRTTPKISLTQSNQPNPTSNESIIFLTQVVPNLKIESTETVAFFPRIYSKYSAVKWRYW